MAYEFSVKGIKNNPDFINDSTFGQLYSQMITKDSEFKMMQNTDSSFFVDKDHFIFSKEEIANAKTNLKDDKGNPMKLVYAHPTSSAEACYLNCDLGGPRITIKDGFFRPDDNYANYDVSIIRGLGFQCPEDCVKRNMERELMSDQLPLFVQTPNGRLNMSTKRDCFNVNP